MADAAPERPDPYAALAALSERQLELACEGRVQELAQLTDDWEQLTLGLPAQPPASARAALEHAMALHMSTGEVLLELRRCTLDAMRTSARASRTAQSYAQIAQTSVCRVDRSA
ncbi:MAG TPA: hypothetical protein VGF47_05615 [Solirubrobacteraceae bacterium]|jgi:hypothetical protein